MPIPQRNPGEGRDEYIGRCISNLSNEYPQDQAAAICYNQLSKVNMAEEVPTVDPKEIEACMLEIRGINPTYSGAIAYKICYDRLTVGKAQSEAEDKGIIDPESAKFAAYPWDECIADMRREGYGKNAAERICGAIRARQ